MVNTEYHDLNTAVAVCGYVVSTFAAILEHVEGWRYLSTI